MNFVSALPPRLQKGKWPLYPPAEELWTEVYDIVQEAVIKTIPKKKKCKKAKWLSKEALQIAVKRREAKSKGENACVAPGKLGLDACGEGERVIALESW